jgi:hypothetical protein
MTDNSDREHERPPTPESEGFFERVREFFDDLREDKIHVKTGVHVDREAERPPTPESGGFFERVREFLARASGIFYISSSIYQRVIAAFKALDTRTFTGMIMRSIVRRRANQLLMFGGMCIVLYVFDAAAALILFIPIVLFFVDMILIIYRQRYALYGNNDLEFREAVRYVINENRSGRGPGRFERVFPVLERRIGQEPDALPARP